MSTGVSFLKLLTQGLGLTQRPLGRISLLTFQQNGVELQFSILSDVYQRYKNLRPTQWAGTEVIWAKQGPIFTGTWRKVHSSQGTGSDDPDPINVVKQNNVIAYWDSPGPNLASYLKDHPSRIYVVQNFTAWIVGEPVAGGVAEQLCEVVAWHSAVSIVDAAWDNPKAKPYWQAVSGYQAATGWGDTSKPPPI